MQNTDTRAMRWTKADSLGLGLVTALAAALRFFRLDQPPFYSGDEHFYVDDACRYLYSAPEACKIAAEANFEHPPLGKWVIALGIRLFGDGPWGYRFFAAALGTLTVVLVYLLARKLLRSSVGATVAALLMSFDFLHFVQSRTAMLDVTLAFCACLAFLCMAFDREADPDSRPAWRYAAGAAAGAAIATKWYGVMALGVVLFLGVAWDILRRRSPSERHPVWRALRERGPGWLLAFVIIPIAVYSITFIGRVHGDLLALPWDSGSWFDALWERQIRTFRFHAEHIWSHRLASEPWAWPLAKRAFVMASKSYGDAKRLVISTGNPLIWIASVAAVLFVGWRWLRQRTQRSVEGLIFAAFALTYLPWFVYAYAPWVFFTWGRVATFVFYFLPTVPILYIAAGYVALRAWRSRWGRGVVVASLAAVGALFALYYPILAFSPLSPGALDARLSLFDQCDPPESTPFVYIKTHTGPDGTVSYEERTVGSEAFMPPDGWCWL